MREPAVLAMAGLRFFSGLLEVLAALLILRANRIETALQVNGVLAFVGPTILLAGIHIGVIGLASRMPPGRLLPVYLGALLIYFGARR